MSQKKKKKKDLFHALTCWMQILISNFSNGRASEYTASFIYFFPLQFERRCDHILFILRWCYFFFHLCYLVTTFYVTVSSMTPRHSQAKKKGRKKAHIPHGHRALLHNYFAGRYSSTVQWTKGQGLYFFSTENYKWTLKKMWQRIQSTHRTQGKQGEGRDNRKELTEPFFDHFIL